MTSSSAPDNANPVVHATPSSNRRRSQARVRHLVLDDDDDDWLTMTPNAAFGATPPQSMHDVVVPSVESPPGLTEAIDSDEIFDLIRSITDPEHPLTLEQLAVVSAPQIHVTDGTHPRVVVEFTPTIPHCSMATLIGLSLRVRLLRSLPERFKVDIKVKEGSHQSENAGMWTHGLYQTLPQNSIFPCIDCNAFGTIFRSQQAIERQGASRRNAYRLRIIAAEFTRGHLVEERDQSGRLPLQQLRSTLHVRCPIDPVGYATGIQTIIIEMYR